MIKSERKKNRGSRKGGRELQNKKEKQGKGLRKRKRERRASSWGLRENRGNEKERTRGNLEIEKS